MKKIHPYENAEFINKILDQIFSFPDDELSLKLQILDHSKSENMQSLLRAAIAANNKPVVECLIKKICGQKEPEFVNAFLEHVSAFPNDELSVKLIESD